MEKCTVGLFFLNNCNSHVYLLTLTRRFLLFFFKLAIFYCTNPLIETCATAISLLFENISWQCYALVILFHFCEVFSNKYICKNYWACRSCVYLSRKTQNTQFWGFGLDFRKRMSELTQNLIKIKKLILFGQKCPNLEIWAQIFRKSASDLKTATSN